MPRKGAEMFGEKCDGCGFEWDSVGLKDAVSGISDAVTEFVGVIEESGEMATVRPSPDRWSIVEYAGHLRDVFISLRERLITASVVDHPTGTPIFRDERVNLGFYALDSVDDAADELGFAAGLLSKTIATLPAGFEDRTMVYSPAVDFVATLRWVAAQANHEAFHHLGDIRENVRLLAGG